MNQTARYEKLDIDDELLSDLINAVHSTIAAVSGIKTQVEATKEMDLEHPCSGDISGTVGMIQTQLEGSLIVSFPQETISALIEPIYGTRFNEINDSVKECVGELTNMIYGQVKESLNQRGYRFQMAIPNIVIGAKHSIHPFHRGCAHSIKFRAGEHLFEALIVVQQG